MTGLSEEVRPAAAPTGDEPGPVARFLVRHAVQALVVAVLFVTAVWQASVYAGGWFGADDFVFQRDAASQGLTWHYLGARHGAHFMPGALLLAWGETRLSPLGWPLTVAVTVLLHVLAGWTFWRLLRTALAPVPLLVLPLVLYVASPLTVPASNWWAASLEALPLLVVLPLAITSHVHLLRTGRSRHAVAAVAWMSLGLLFSVKAVLVLPVLVLLSGALGSALGFRVTLGGALRRARLELALGTAALTAYALVYATARHDGAPGSAALPHRVSDLLSFFLEGLGHVLVPGIVGGPWHWVPTNAPTAIAAVPFLPMLISWVVVGLVVVAALRLRPSTATAWLAVLLWVCGELGVVALGRLNQFGSAAALETHYVADAAPLVWLAVALSFCRRRGEAGGAPWSRLQLPSWVTQHGAGVAVALTVVGALSAADTVHAFTVERQPRQTARTFVETAAREVRRAGPGLQLVDRAVPPLLLDSVFFPDGALTSNALLPVLPAARRDELFPPYAEKPKAFDDTGHLRATRVTGVPLRTSPFQSCGWLMQDGSTATLPWSRRLYAWDWFVRVGYVAKAPTTATWTFGRTTVTTELHAGLGEVTFPVSGGGDTLTVSVPPDASVCIGDAQIGSLELVR